MRTGEIQFSGISNNIHRFFVERETKMNLIFLKKDVREKDMCFYRLMDSDLPPYFNENYHQILQGSN